MKINYILNTNNEIISYVSVPIDDTKPTVEVLDTDIVCGWDKVINGEFVKGDRVAYKAILEANKIEMQNKALRNRYLDAYRKYQSAVNYGEVAKVVAIDEFISKLRNKDWTAYENTPPQIKYFTGELGFTESGLKEQL